MNALTYLNGLRPALPMLKAGKALSNSELIRMMDESAVLINGEKVHWKEEINFPVFSLVFFPSSKRKTTLV